MKIAVILGTRPELIKLSCVIRKLSTNFSLTLIHTGQNYDPNLDTIFYDDLDLSKPDHYLNCNSGDLGENVGSVISRSYTLLQEIKPDAVVILGDTNSALAAYSAKRLHIPIFHMEAGNRCFDQRVPEEINRVLVDHLSDVNLPYTQIAKSYLQHEGIPADRLIVTGSPMKEVLKFYDTKIMSSTILNDLGLTPNRYFLLSTHRSENVDNPRNLFATLTNLNDIALKYGTHVIFPCHPRTKSKVSDISTVTSLKNISLIDPVNFTDYISLQKSARLVFSDSGTVSEESNILGFKAINIRYNHERPEVFEEGTIPFGLPTSPNFPKLVNFMINQKMDNFRIVNDYNVDNVSDKIVNIIASYTDYINRFTWSKD